jgi:hypothetical protein
MTMCFRNAEYGDQQHQVRRGRLEEPPSIAHDVHHRVHADDRGSGESPPTA